MMLISVSYAAAPPPRTALLEDDGRCARRGRRPRRRGGIVGGALGRRGRRAGRRARGRRRRCERLHGAGRVRLLGFSRCESIDTDRDAGRAGHDPRPVHAGASARDGARLPFANASFDVVSFSFVLHHVSSAAAQRRLLDEARPRQPAPPRHRRGHGRGRRRQAANEAARAARRHEFGGRSDSRDECYRSEAVWRQLLGEHGFEVERAADGNAFLDYNSVPEDGVQRVATSVRSPRSAVERSLV